MYIQVGKLRVKKKYIAALLLGISASVGIVRFILYLIPRSKPDNQLIWGLSAARVFLGSIFLGLLLINIGGFLLTLINFGKWQEKLEEKIYAIFSSHHIIIMAVLYILLAITGTFFLLTIPPIIRPLRFLVSYSIRLSGFLTWVLIGDLLLIVMLRIIAAETFYKNQNMARLDTIFTCVGFFVATFVLYLQTAILIGWINKTTYSFFDLLAEQFIQGKLYLEDPPYTHDLTLYKGKWYAPMPPLPAILLMPFAYFLGADGISTSYLSMIVSAANGVLLFLILNNLNSRKWINLSTSGIFTIVILFLFGTPHLWLGISGRGWYFSQVLTAFFLAFAIYAALRSWSAWSVGALIATAMTARPTALMTWPFLLAITLQILKENQEEVELKHVVQWSAKTVVPISVAVIGLLTYNYLRFENFLDFGYVTVNAGPDIVRNVQQWGTFSPHFIPINLSVMLFKLPFWNPGGRWFILPSATGMSVFLTTPALIYLFRRYSKDWWVIGAWAAVFFSVALLSLYHNTGAHQFGYRYILDFLTPLIVLLAVGFKKKTPWHFQLLVVISIAINLYGTHWFMNG
ncbi:MAG: hypothetical protein HN736_16825 [Anaerolineae bacterium]|jgi:hypothetical protein|nr:hypothetical protein [Anaerolineae bacterium]MBT3712149.1 hypothetical protein [Anaerolineae bacterium]MBT4311562.1 hypothetical protein [Anaerolineae bacterium]MBT4842441.1 hypothetical protein [Anaerolineae bacterium]MBT6061724.1 hypothetical protein [Anaerolineae bacterium]